MDEKLIFCIALGWVRSVDVLQSFCVLNQTQSVPPCNIYGPKMVGAVFISDDLVRKVWSEKCLDVLSCKVVVFSTRLNLSPHPSAHNVWDTCEGPISEEPVWKNPREKIGESVQDVGGRHSWLEDMRKSRSRR